MQKIEFLVNKFNEAKENHYTSYELNIIADKILDCVMHTYSLYYSNFINRHGSMTEFELRKWNFLNSLFDGKENIKLLDCAFGSGRDLLYAKNCGYDIYGCELNPQFYSQFVQANKLNRKKIVNADIRYLPFENNMFDIVRHNASFLHMPIIGTSYTIHKCIEESYRVLKPNGLLYIMTKEGDGYTCLDTCDGLGLRPFQYFNNKTITTLLQEYGLHILKLQCFQHKRNHNVISWIEVIAYK